MIIQLKAIHCNLEETLKDSFLEAFNRRFSKYSMLRSADINITKLTEISWEATISMVPNRGDYLFVKATDETVEKTYASALEKAERVIKKFQQSKQNITRETLMGDPQ